MAGPHGSFRGCDWPKAERASIPRESQMGSSKASFARVKGHHDWSMRLTACQTNSVGKAIDFAVCDAASVRRQILWNHVFRGCTRIRKESTSCLIRAHPCHPWLNLCFDRSDTSQKKARVRGPRVREHLVLAGALLGVASIAGGCSAH
jgi:hypothetical protein